jgi:glycosyltransferase involved in cell wall biosynthesis
MIRPLVFDLRYATARYPGVGAYAVGLAEALLAAKPGWPWRMLIPDGDDRFDLSFVPQAMRSPPAPTPTPLRGQLELGARLRDLDAALYHSPYLLRPWRAPCPSIVTVHDVIPLEHHAGMSGPRRAVYRWLVGDALGAACVVTDSATSRGAILAVYRGAKRPPPSRDRAPGSTGSRAGARRPPADPVVVHPGCRIVESGKSWPAWPRPAVLTVGINKPHKNLVTLMRALSLIPRQHRPLLVCAGPVDRRFPDPRALAGVLGVTDDVVALGLVPEDRLAALYRSATLFAFPTRIEGFGLPLLEAMMLGVPAIVSDLPVLREISGDAVLRAPADDEQGWADLIAALLEDTPRRAHLAELGRQRAREFSYAAAARQLIAEYEALVPELAAAHEASDSRPRPPALATAASHMRAR